MWGVEQVGGDQVKILTFAASKHLAASIFDGQQAKEKAEQKVRIEPELPNVYPAFTNCLDIAPPKTTEYRLVAEDKTGKSVDASVTINVR